MNELTQDYKKSLTEKEVSEDLRVSVKNIYENLRSCLDYMAKDISEEFCPTPQKKPYFPIRYSPKEFTQAISSDFPNLEKTSPRVLDILEGVQPYNDPWLGQFNKLNNHNKHQDLAGQNKVINRQTKVSREGCSVSWSSGVTFSAGVKILGVPIDQHTQRPIENKSVSTEIIDLVGFYFVEIQENVLQFSQLSITKVDELIESLQRAFDQKIAE